MNKLGSVTIYALCLSLVIIILALALIPAGKQFIDATMNQTTYTNATYEILNSSGDIEIIQGQIENVGLDCNNSTISYFNKAACITTDFSMAYFFGGLILIALAVAVAKVVF